MSEHSTWITRHDVSRCNTARHAEGGICGTYYEAHCSCGFGQGASCREQAAAIARGHRADPAASVIAWDPGPPLTANTITDQDLRDLFARHCACQPFDLERSEDDHAAIHDCDTEILDDVQTALFSTEGDEALAAKYRCAEYLNKRHDSALLSVCADADDDHANCTVPCDLVEGNPSVRRGAKSGMRFSDAFARVTRDLLVELGSTDPAVINHGNCDAWANRMMELVGGEARWLDSIIDPDDFPINMQPRVRHCALLYQGRWYDSEHPDGVEHVLVLAGFDTESACAFEGLLHGGCP